MVLLFFPWIFFEHFIFHFAKNTSAYIVMFILFIFLVHHCTSHRGLEFLHTEDIGSRKQAKPPNKKLYVIRETRPLLATKATSILR